MRVLCVGGAGFIGSHIVDALLLGGHEVRVLDNFSSGYEENIPSFRFGINLFERSVSRYLGVIEIVDKFQPDVICHQAAQSSLRRSIDDPAHDAEVNIIGTLNVIRAAKSCGAHIVFASTGAVYDTSIPSEHAFQEDDELGPVSPYGLSKLTAEKYLALSGVSHTILRYGNVYGPRQVRVGENQLVPHCLEHLLDGRTFLINGDGEQTRDFVYVEDIARANVLAIESRVQGTFNCARGAGVSVNNICATLARLCGKPNYFAHGEAKLGEARHIALDSDKAFEVMGWEATTGDLEGLERTVNWWREHR